MGPCVRQDLLVNGGYYTCHLELCGSIALAFLLLR